MTTTFRDQVPISHIDGLPGEVNKYGKFDKAFVLAPQLINEEYAQKVRVGDNFRFTVDNFGYTELHPAIYLESTIDVKAASTSAIAIAGEEITTTLAKYLSNENEFIDATADITGFKEENGVDTSRVAIFPCPVQRAMVGATVTLGESVVSGVPPMAIDDLINMYSPDSWDTDMSFAGAGTKNYGAAYNKIKIGTAAGVPAGFIRVKIVEPLIAFPALFGGESACGLQKVSALPSLNKFALEFNLITTPNDKTRYTPMNEIPPIHTIGEVFISSISTPVQYEIKDVDVRIRKVMPNELIGNMSIETKRLATFFNSEVYETDPADGSFHIQLPQNTVSWEKLFLRAYAVMTYPDNKFIVPIPITRLTGETVTANIVLPDGMTYEKLQQYTRLNGYGGIFSNNTALNALGKYAVCLDANQLALNNNTGVVANTIISQDWSFRVETGGNVEGIKTDGAAYYSPYKATYLVVNTMWHGTADTSLGGYHAEQALFDTSEVVDTLTKFAKKKDLKMIASQAYAQGLVSPFDEVFDKQDEVSQYI